jgi:hypothetical protein
MVTHKISPTASQAPLTPYERFLALPLMEQAVYHQAGDYYMAHCPVHGTDSKPSLLIREDPEDGHVVILCFAGCQRADICAAIGLTESDLYRTSQTPFKKKPIIDADRKITLLDLALAKLIHPLLLSLEQIEDGFTYRSQTATIRNVVKIPYFNEDGTLRPRSRIRTALSAASGSFWDGLPTDKIAPYGLHRLQEARAAGYLWIVEGESDVWTQWQHGEPALGIPGATNTDVLQASHLRDINTLYIVREPQTPGKKGDAGRTFVERLQIRLKEIGYQGEAYVIDLKDSHNVKDPNELHIKLFTEGRYRDYKSELQRAIHEAAPLSIAAPQKPEVDLATMQVLVRETLAKRDPAAVYELASQLAGLQAKDKAVISAQIATGTTDNQIPGFSKRDFNRLVREATVALKQEQNQPNLPRVINRRDIILTGDIEEDAEATLTALYAANHPPVIFIRGAKLARCRLSEEGRPFIEEVTPDILLYEMSRITRFLVYSQTKGALKPTYPPVAVARYILAKGNWRFPPLRGVTEVPIVRDDGTLLDTPGYDPQSRLIYLPQPGLVIPPVPATPTQAEVDAARDYVWQFFAEFCYESQADAANAFGALLTTVTRTMYPLCPMHLVDGVKPGTGKTLWVQALAYIALGRIIASSTVPQDETEWQKTLTSYLLAGTSFLSLDNIRGLLISAQLEAFLTSPSWSGRILGTNQTPELIQRAMVVGNGNNLEIGGDLPRRCVRIRLTTINSQPWMQTGFAFSPLLKHLQLHRGQIISALLTLVRSWIVAGKPVPATVPALGTFDGWSETIGGILAHIGIPGFLENLAELYNETDSDGPQWANFLEAWEQVLGMQKLTAGEIVEAMRSNQSLADTLPENLVTGFREESKSFNKVFGKALRDRRGTPYGPNNIRLACSEDKHKKQKLWSIVSSPNAGLKPRLWIITGTATTSQEETVETSEPTDKPEISDGDPPVPVALPLHTETEALRDLCTLPSCQEKCVDIDSAGNLWCELHAASRGQLINIGSRLHPPYPSLNEIGLGFGEERWSVFTETALEDQVSEALASATQLANQQRDHPQRE